VPFDSRISLNKLEIFCRVVELESVSRAARELYVSQPVVSGHMQSLQDRLGVKLLYRDGHRMRPTEAGAVIYDWARDILLRSYEMARRIEGLQDGTEGAAAVAASMTVGSYLLPRALSRFCARRPGAHVTLKIVDPEHAVSEVEAGGCDLAVLIAQRELFSATIACEQLAEEPFVLVAAPGDDPPDTISAGRIADLPFVAAPHDLVRERLVERQLEAGGIRHGPIVMELGHAEAMNRAVREGIGVAFLLRTSVAEELESGALREITVSNLPTLMAPVYLAYREGRSFSPLQHALLAEIRAELGGDGPALE
jgi:LysR family transcriptional regulator, low CO2-responsive transcriptional regulator